MHCILIFDFAVDFFILLRSHLTSKLSSICLPSLLHGSKQTAKQDFGLIFFQ